MFGQIVDSVASMIAQCLGVFRCACLIRSTDSFEEFANKVIHALSSIKYKWVLVLIANYHSQSRAVKYILDNFATIDVLSKDIDFYFPGYGNVADMPIIPDRMTAQKDVLEKAILQLRKMANEKKLSGEEIDAIKVFESECCSLVESRQNSDMENFHGDSKLTEIRCKRLGRIRFSEEAFANFVADLMKNTKGHYNYLGGCDLVMIPFLNDELKYQASSVFHLENIANKETRISVDEFLLRVIDTIDRLNGKLDVPKICGEKNEVVIGKFKKCARELQSLLDASEHIPESVNDLLTRSNNLIAQCDNPLYRFFRKKTLVERAKDLLEDIRENRDFIVNQVVVRGLLESLYREAIKEVPCPTEEEIIGRIIFDIERHVHWRLSEDFYFISYSTKDKMKAELIRRKLQEQSKRVWIAPDGIPQGRDYSMVIPMTLRHTKYFVLILTENSARSKWVSREIDAAINNSSARLKIILANGFQLNQLGSYPDIGFYLNKVQVSFRYEDLIQDENVFQQFLV